MLKKLRYSNTGFTLIEMMIVVVIVGVLTLVAYPSYQRFVVKANRAEAQSYLMDAAQKQQLYFNDSRTYATYVQLDVDGTIPPRVDDNYTVGVTPTVGPPPTFTITATPKPGSPQAKYSDGVLSINNAGAKLRGVEPW